MSIQDFKKRIPQVIFENPDELISGGEHQKLLLDGVDLVEAELNKKADSKDVKTELDKKVDNTSFDEYKKEQELVNDSKVDKENYKQDLDAVNDRINASDAGVSENKQELNGIKKLLSETADSSKVVGTAKGGGVITFPSNVLTNASPRYRVNGATDDEFKSVQAPMRIKSVGENLFNIEDKSQWTKYMSITPEGWIINNTEFYTVCSLPNIQKGVEYRCYFIPQITVDDSALRISVQTKYGYVNSSYMLGGASGSVKKGVRRSFLFTNNTDDIPYLLVTNRVPVSDIYIVKEDGHNSSFEEYKESIAYINNNSYLSRVGDVADYIENSKLHQNIKRHYFSKSDEWTLRDDYEGANFRYYMTLPFEYKATGVGIEGELLCNNFAPTSNVASVLTERESGTIALYRENASTIYLTLDKKVSDVNSVIPEGTFVDVILPQTEVTNLDTSGMVVARPNGTVFIEPVANLTAFYNDGLDVSTLTIEEVESFSTFKDGNYQELDVSKVSIKDGKLTHPDAVNGLCYLVYRHDNAPIYGNNEVDYYNSEKTLKSPNGKVWKKIEEATDEGELVTKLEEVK